jgi:erythromycin esterase-like protein
MRFFSILLLFSIVFLIQCRSSAQQKGLDDFIRANVNELHSSSDLDILISHAADKKIVLLGEASHGTHEYYAWRDSISRRLISEHNFNFIAVEGDFAMLFELNRYVKDMPGAASSAREVLVQIDRWPLWMWGNEETVALAEWLKEYNQGRDASDKVGFYGMDVYDEWRSKRAVLNFLRDKNPTLYSKAKQSYDCFMPFVDNSWDYARAAVSGDVNCSERPGEVIGYFSDYRHKLADENEYDLFYALQNAYVFHNAEKFYRKSMDGRSADSWNARVLHMHETVLRLLDLYGEDSRAIVWAHNTHIGDAAYAGMLNRNQFNIGHLARNHFGADDVLLVGFTTYSGRVQAGLRWGSARQNMPVPEAQKNSIEEILKRAGSESFYLIFDESARSHPEFMQSLGNRAIGVVYDPRNDRHQYVPTIVPMRYDALIYFERTKALSPLID